MKLSRSAPLLPTDCRPQTCPACLQPFSPARAMPVVPTDDSEQLNLWGKPWHPSELRYARCDCGSLIAIDERRQPGALDDAYGELPETYWTGLNKHQRLAAHLSAMVNASHPGGDVWDVGCGDGGLLEALKITGRRSGIEPGASAVAAAQRRGLDVRLGSAASLGLRQVADVVLAIDLLEHLPEPERELRAMATMLKPGGVLIALTGDAASAPARVGGPWWYYLHCLGHVTVFSKAALNRNVERAGLRVTQIRRFNHPGAVSLDKWAKRLIGNAARLALGRPTAAVHYFHDHLLVVARAEGTSKP